MKNLKNLVILMFFYERNFFWSRLSREFFFTFNQNYKIYSFLKLLKKVIQIFFIKNIFSENNSTLEKIHNINQDQFNQELFFKNYLYSFFKYYFKKFKYFYFKKLFFTKTRSFLFKTLKMGLFFFSNYSYFFKFYRFIRTKFLFKNILKKYIKNYHIRRYGNAYYMRHYPFQKLKRRKNILLRRLKRWFKKKTSFSSFKID